MGLKDLARTMRDRRIPLEQARRANREAMIGDGVMVSGEASRLRLARGVSIWGPTVLDCSDGGGLTGGLVEIGERSYVGEFNNIRAAGAPIRIGADCLVSQHITIVGTNHGIAKGRTIASQDWDGDGVVIGDDVWVGAGAVILPGARIGDGAVVAANSVVRGEVPPGAIVAGTPAKVLRYRD